MKFAFLGYSLEKNWVAMTKSQQDAMVEDCFTYDSKLLKEGHLIGDGVPLQPSRTAKTLRWREGAVIVTDGPFVETKEQLGGVGLLEATDMAQAVELISKHPGLHYGAVFEIRPIDEESLKQQATAIAALCTSAPAADPQSPRFASLGYIDESGWGSISEDDRAAMMSRCIAFDRVSYRERPMEEWHRPPGPAYRKDLTGQSGTNHRHRRPLRRNQGTPGRNCRAHAERPERGCCKPS
ncbi:MAG TPA: YciI family protein [Planctomycetaceae bacterium]|jgi:hypothetical protein|nr:YciI family protein [Planctomycetaceae bacterium]